MRGTDESPKRASVNVGVPSVPRSIKPRARVNLIINEALDSSSLLVVRAPEIFGKTTAVAGWAASDHGYGPVVWVDAAETAGTEPIELWREILSGASLLPGLADDTPHGPAAETLDLLGQGAPALEAFRGLCTALLPDIPEGVLILDSVQGSLPEGFLNTLIILMRRFEGLRVIIVTNQDLHLASTPAGMVLDARSIGSEELRLTPDEVRACLASESSGLDADEVIAHTSGHPSLVRAAVAAHRFDPADTDVRRSVTDFIRAGIVQSDLGIRHLDFLLRTSVAKRLTVELAVELSGLVDARTILMELAGRGYIRRRRRPGGDVFCYDKTLRRALREELEEQHPGLVPALQRMMVNHYLSCGEPLPALEVAVGIGDLDLANQVIRDHQVELRTLHAERTKSLLEAIPDASLSGRPVLAVTLAMIRHGGDRDHFRTAELMELALAAAEGINRSSPLADRASAALTRTVALRSSSQWKEAAKAADAGAALLAAAGVADRWKHRKLAVAVYIQAAATHLLTSNHDHAETLLHRALSIAMEQKMASSVQQAGGLLALTLALTGRILAATTVLSQSPVPADGNAIGTDFSSIPYRLAAALVALEAGNLDEAAAQLALAGPAARAGEFWVHAMIIRLAVDVLTDPRRLDLDEANRALNRPELPSPSVPLRTSLITSVSTAHLAAGNAGRAVAAVQGLDSRNAKVALVLARASLAIGEDARAGALLSSARTAGLNERGSVQLLMLRAVVHERAGRVREAEEAAQSGLRIMKRTGLSMTLLMVPHSDVYALLAAGVTETGPALPVISRALVMAQLTAREQVVLRSLAEFGSAAETARSLVVSVNTIKAQTRSIYRKLGVTTLQSALAVAELQGLLPEQ
ncbi:MAG TPA: LuxR C-terminal-related transcriptional regulator [Arthrobacter sp.]